jgi:hypothetical protein
MPTKRFSIRAPLATSLLDPHQRAREKRGGSERDGRLTGKCNPIFAITFTRRDATPCGVHLSGDGSSNLWHQVRTGKTKVLKGPSPLN